jgi:hypothetical protein
VLQFIHHFHHHPRDGHIFDIIASLFSAFHHAFIMLFHHFWIILHTSSFPASCFSSFQDSLHQSAHHLAWFSFHHSGFILHHVCHHASFIISGLPFIIFIISGIMLFHHFTAFVYLIKRPSSLLTSFRHYSILIFSIWFWVPDLLTDRNTIVQLVWLQGKFCSVFGVHYLTFILKVNFSALTTSISQSRRHLQ